MFTALVTVALVVAADPPKQKEFTEEAKKELKRLEGKWKVEKMAAGGVEITPKDGDLDYVVEIQGGKWHFVGQLKAEIIAIDPTTTPKCLDMKSLEKGRNGVVEEAIYQLDGETLTIALYQGMGKNRPTTFDVPKERDTILAVLKRIKDEPKKDK